MIINEIDIIKKSSELEIKYFNMLLNTFKYEENQNNINYNVIHNIINFDEILQKYKVKLLNKINNESNKFISSLKTFGFREPYKNINNPSSICPHILHLSILKDGRLAACSNTNLVYIYKKDTFELQFTIKEHSGTVNYFFQLNNNNILTCSYDRTMKIIKLTEDNKYNLEQNLTGHSDAIFKAIEIRDNVLISVSNDKTMKIWNLNNNNNKYECINTINSQNPYSCSNILKLNENEFVTSGDGCLKFWNSNNYTNISNIENIITGCYGRQLCKLEDDILCVGGLNSSGFYLIKISTHQLIKNITGPFHIYSIYKCLDGLFLCSITANNNHSLVIYKYENQILNKVIEKENASYDYIFTCIQLNDEMIASAGSGSNIKLWKK